MWLPLLLAGVLSLVNAFGHDAENRFRKYHFHLISLAAGLFLTYLFLEWIPQLAERAAPLLGRQAYLFLFGGFAVFHLLEKHAYQHDFARQRSRELSELHLAGFGLEGFIVGMLVVFLLGLKTTAVELATFLPFLLHSVSSSLILQHLEERIPQGNARYLAAFPFLGALFATFVPLSEAFFYSLFSALVGALLYVAIRHALPPGKQGNKALFVIGALFGVILLELVKRV